MRPPGNIVGQTVSRLRTKRGLSQAALAAKCQRLGWDISREVLARIESRIRCVTDAEIAFLAKALGVEIADLFERKGVAALFRVSNQFGRGFASPSSDD